jgi:DNA replication licensing factor MCM4
MRDTGQTNLNLDVVDLQAFRWQQIMAAGPGGPQSREDREFSQLYRNFMLYPQELVPILDQQLKDSALEWACEEENLGIDGMERVENEQRAREMHQSVFKVRPYAGETRVNMRDLNPQGQFLSLHLSVLPQIDEKEKCRHRQDRLHQGFGNSSDPYHSGYETR